jgi:hypothetical protein
MKGSNSTVEKGRHSSIEKPRNSSVRNSSVEKPDRPQPRGSPRAYAANEMPMCALTIAPLVHPVALGCGHTYEAEALENYRLHDLLSEKACCVCKTPIPNANLPCFGLAVNVAMRELIQTLNRLLQQRDKPRTQFTRDQQDEMMVVNIPAGHLGLALPGEGKPPFTLSLGERGQSLAARSRWTEEENFTRRVYESLPSLPYAWSSFLAGFICAICLAVGWFIAKKHPIVFVFPGQHKH